VLYASPVKAEGPYPWSDTPLMNEGREDYHGDRGFTRPRHEETYGQMRQREYNSRQERDRQERGEPSNSPSARPPSYQAYQEQYWIQGPDGRSTLCVPQYSKGIVSCY